MDIGIFQLLPAGAARSDGEVIEQALWEVDFAEERGLDSVWITEHHFSGFGLVSAPSVYAAAVAQRTRRIRIGYGVAVVPLHHPLRLAEEISWVDHLSRGRVMVGLGPGFSPDEFGGFGVPLDERHARMREGAEIVHRALSEPELEFHGTYWQIPRVEVRPRPYTRPHPPFFRASSSEESLREAAGEGMPVLFGLKSVPELRQRLELYRTIRAQMSVDADTIEREIGEMYVLRRFSIAPTDEEAITQIAEEEQRNGLATTCHGSPTTVARQLHDLHTLGLRKLIAWFHFGNMPYAKVRRSMELLHREVLPALRESQSLAAAGVRKAVFACA